MNHKVIIAFVIPYNGQILSKLLENLFFKLLFDASKYFKKYEKCNHKKYEKRLLQVLFLRVTMQCNKGKNKGFSSTQNKSTCGFSVRFFFIFELIMEIYMQLPVICNSNSNTKNYGTIKCAFRHF